MIPTLQAMIEDAIKEAKLNYTPSREISLIITKLEEALLWFQKRP